MFTIGNAQDNCVLITQRRFPSSNGVSRAPRAVEFNMICFSLSANGLLLEAT